MHLKLQSKYFKIVLITGLLLLEGLSFAQSPEGGINNPTTNPNIPTEVEKPSEAPQEEHSTEELDQLLKRYNKDAEKILEDNSKLHNIQEGSAKSEVNESDIEEMKASGQMAQEIVDPNIAIKEKKQKAESPKVLPSTLSDSVRMALEPLQQLSEEELLKRLDEATRESSVRPYLDQFPSMTLFTVRLIKDKESIPTLAKIAEDRKRLINFVGIMVLSIILGIVLKNVMHKEGRTFLQAVFYFFLRFWIMLIVRICIINYFFGEELKPAMKVFKQTFMT
jgi:hypothetical protein